MTSSSSHAHEGGKTRSIAHTAVTFDDTFWAPRLQNIREQTLPFIYEQMKQDGHFTAFQQTWKAGMNPIPYVFWESDISKWIEAASYSLATQPDDRLAELVDEAVTFLISLQQPDGYLNLWFTKVEPEKRWTNLRDYHELYCAGHMIEAAVALFQATGKRVLLDAVCRYVDYIDRTFGPNEGQRRGYCGHEEIELSLIKLYHATGEGRYLRLCQYFIEERGKLPHYFDQEAIARGDEPVAFWAKTYEYNQSHLPVREQAKVVGHAVRAMYLLCAVADLAHELQDAGFQQTCERLWNDLSSKLLYVTGGLGSAAVNEGFTGDYDLPNLDAYAETCAGIGLVMYAQRMLLLDTDHRYADIMERALYNGVLSSVAWDGTSFFYVNPLEGQGTHHRMPWFKCACCPPNLARLLLSLGQYLYTVDENDLAVHLYIQSTSTIDMDSGAVILQQKTNYPWDGTVRIELELEEPAEFGLKLRIPGWCKTARLIVAGEEVPLEVHKGYAHIVRCWQSGDSLELCLEMPVERIYAHPSVRDDIGCVALQRGPLVYCLEAIDNAVPLHQVSLPEDAVLESSFDPALLHGVIVIKGDAQVAETEDWPETLYRSTPPIYHTHPLVAIPYYAWDHRTSEEMRVWIRTLQH